MSTENPYDAPLPAQNSPPSQVPSGLLQIVQRNRRVVFVLAVLFGLGAALQVISFAWGLWMYGRNVSFLEQAGTNLTYLRFAIVWPLVLGVFLALGSRALLTQHQALLRLSRGAAEVSMKDLLEQQRRFWSLLVWLLVVMFAYRVFTAVYLAWNSAASL